MRCKTLRMFIIDGRSPGLDKGRRDFFCNGSKKKQKKEKGENNFKTFVTLLGGAHKEFNLTDYYI